VITPAAGKRLIGRALAVHPAVRSVLNRGTLVIIAGTTNGYVVQEIFRTLGRNGDFSRRSFFRGVTVPPGVETSEMGRLTEQEGFPGDVVLMDGIWKRGATVFDVLDDLQEGDLILKGANALNLSRRQVAVLIGHPRGGTIGAILQAVVGRRVGLLLPVGLEKRVDADLYELAHRVNAPGSDGPRLLPIPAPAFTEFDALQLLAGVKAELMAAGGVLGAEGSVWITVEGSPEACEKAEDVIKSISHEPDFASGMDGDE